MKLIDKTAKLFHAYSPEKIRVSLSACKPDVYHFCILLFLSIIAYSSILRSPLFYVDDAVRVFTHTNINQGVHGRPLADLAYGFLSNGQFIDISPFSQICALALLLASGMLIVRAFSSRTDEKTLAKWLPLLFAVLPINYSIISYRYDSISMSLGVFCASLAFVLTYKVSNAWRICGSSFLLFSTLSLYQPMIGVYTCLCCAYAAHAVIRESWKTVVRRCMLQVLATCCAAILYLPVYMQSRYASAYKFADLSNHPHAYPHGKIIYYNIIKNIYNGTIAFINSVLSYIGTDILSICIIITFCLFIISLIKINTSWQRKILVLVFIFFSFLSCNTANYALQSSGIIAPRTLIPICMFILCVFIFVLYNFQSAYYLLAILIIVSIINSSSILTSIGNAHRDQHIFNQKMIMYTLIDDFKDIYKKHGKFSFAIINEVPVHNAMNKLTKKYKYIHGASSFLFIGMEIMTYIPINYSLHANFEDIFYRQRVSSLPTMMDRIAYSIVYDKSTNTYAVLLKSDYLPAAVPKYESDAPLFFLKRKK